MRANLSATGRNYYDAITLLEELGFECKEDNDSTLCLNNDKRMAFRINKLR